MFINKYNNVCIVDVRFKEEANWLKEIVKAKVIRIERDYELREPFMCGRNPKNPAEINLDSWKKFDCVITNNKKKENLYKELDKISSSLKLKTSCK